MTISGVAPGRHRITLTASDYQEAKNMENTGRSSRTRAFSASFVAR